MVPDPQILRRRRFTFQSSVGANVTAFASTGLLASTTYYYRVTAREAGGAESDVSNTASATTYGPLAAPSNLAATASGNQISLTWTDNSASEAAFQIYRSTDAVAFTAIASVSANVTSYVNSGLQASTTYYYRVSAKDSTGGESAMSNTASATTAGVPAAPSTLIASAVSSSQIDLNWTDNSSNESGFRIDRSSDGTTFSTLAWVGANVTFFANTGRPPSTTYHYRVVAYNGVGYSTPSNIATATTHGSLPAPGGLTASPVTATRVDLSWTDNSTNEVGFRVFRSTDGTNFTLLGTTGANVTTYSNTSAAPATTYYYRVTAYDSGGGQSAPSNTVTVTTPSVPTPPSGLMAAAVSSTQISLSWTDNSDNETHFRIDWSTNGVTFSTLTWVSANMTTFNHTGRTAGTTYYYRVAAYNSNGSSTTSNVASATTLP